MFSTLHSLHKATPCKVRLPLYFLEYQRVVINMNQWESELLYSLYNHLVCSRNLVSHFLYRNVSTPRCIAGVTATTIPCFEMCSSRLMYKFTIVARYCIALVKSCTFTKHLYFLVERAEPKAMQYTDQEIQCEVVMEFNTKAYLQWCN